jgi:beta-glucanase (GH16 family)
MASTFVNPSAAHTEAAGLLSESPGGRPLTLVFADNFQSFDPWIGQDSVWRTAFGAGSSPNGNRDSVPNSGEPERLSTRVGGRNPFSVNKGIFEIAASPTPSAAKIGLADYPYISGLITTRSSFSQTYGYFEMRARLPRGSGLWPAFWMLPQDQSWPPEIDIVESVGDPSHVYVTAHSKLAKSEGFEAHIAPQAFHIFAVSWDERQIIWYIDGVEIGRVPTPADMHKPMYLLANLAVSGNWPGAPDTATRAEAKLMIDYIRAYRFADG